MLLSESSDCDRFKNVYAARTGYVKVDSVMKSKQLKLNPDMFHQNRLAANVMSTIKSREPW